MRNSKTLEENEKCLIEAFVLQNEEAYDEAFEYINLYFRKLDIVGNNLIAMIDSIEKNSEFYMRVMPIMKQ